MPTLSSGAKAKKHFAPDPREFASFGRSQEIFCNVNKSRQVLFLLIDAEASGEP
jgi:hypothetical protein